AFAGAGATAAGFGANLAGARGLTFGASGTLSRPARVKSAPMPVPIAGAGGALSMASSASGFAPRRFFFLAMEPGVYPALDAPAAVRSIGARVLHRDHRARRGAAPARLRRTRAQRRPARGQRRRAPAQQRLEAPRARRRQRRSLRAGRP